MSSAKVTISGFIGNIEMKYTPAGAGICEFSIATGRKWKDKNTGETKEKTSWHNLKAFGKTAENITKYFQKGSGIICFGDLEVETWEDKNGGGKRSKTVINVHTFDFPPVRKNSDATPTHSSGAPNPPHQTPQTNNDDFDDDIPF